MKQLERLELASPLSGGTTKDSAPLVLRVLRHGLPRGNGTRHLCKQYWTRPSLGHFGLKSPADDGIGIDQVRCGMNHGAGPVFLSDRADFCGQRILRIGNQTKRERALWVLPKGLVILVRRLIDLSVANDPLAQLPAVFSGLRADPENRDVVFLVSSVLINKGRNLGPAPRSPLTAVKENN